MCFDEKIKKKYEEYWNMENHNRPLVSIKGTDAFEMPQYGHKNLQERWFDTEYVIDKVNLTLDHTYFGCEAYPIFSPDLGPDQFAAFYGADLVFGETTSWAKNPWTDAEVEEIPEFSLNRDGIYYKKLKELMKALLENGRGRYFTGIPDLHPGPDCLVAMRGPEQLCFDTIENPEFIIDRTIKLFDGFRLVYEDFYNLAKDFQTGSSNWMEIWHPGKWYVTSCDFSCMISQNMYEELVIPELMMEIEYLDASVYHLDGPDALKHLDRILQIKKLKGVQWVYGAGAPSASHWLHIIKKIQDAGKLVHIDVEPGELEYMLQNIKPEGVLLRVNAASKKEAKELEELVHKYD